MSISLSPPHAHPVPCLQASVYQEHTRRWTRTVQGSALHRSAHLLTDTLHNMQYQRHADLNIWLECQHDLSACLCCCIVTGIWSAQLLHCCDGLPPLLQASVVLDPYAIAVVGRRQYGALGPVSLHASTCFTKHALCSADSILAAPH